jgi:cyanuric acid amidohydrolase
MAHPEDMGGLAAILSSGVLDRKHLRAIFIKTEGNGLDNDWSRPLALRALDVILQGDAAPLRIVSGGCEGILTPHMTVIAAVPTRGSAPSGPALAVGTAVSPPLSASDIGRRGHAAAARDTVIDACRDAGLAIDAVEWVHIVSPWLSPALRDAAQGPADLIANDAHASKPAIRYSAAIGAGMALGEIGDAPDFEHWRPGTGPRTSRISVTAGDTAGRLQVIVMGHADDGAWTGPLRIRCDQMQHMLDVPADTSQSPARLVAAFFKGDPPAADHVDGRRTVMGSDSDIHAFRHFRAAMSGIFGVALGTSRVFIGGGAEAQCAPGGGLLTRIFDSTDHEPQ